MRNDDCGMVLHRWYRRGWLLLLHGRRQLPLHLHALHALHVLRLHVQPLDVLLLRLQVLLCHSLSLQELQLRLQRRIVPKSVAQLLRRRQWVGVWQLEALR